MNTETILLIVSLFSNAVIILKKIKVIWTPCLIIQCSQSVEDNTPSTDSNSEGNRALRIKRFITERFTPRRTQQTQVVNENPV